MHAHLLLHLGDARRCVMLALDGLLKLSLQVGNGLVLRLEALALVLEPGLGGLRFVDLSLQHRHRLLRSHTPCVFGHDGSGRVDHRVARRRHLDLPAAPRVLRSGVAQRLLGERRAHLSLVRAVLRRRLLHQSLVERRVKLLLLLLHCLLVLALLLIGLGLALDGLRWRGLILAAIVSRQGDRGWRSLTTRHGVDVLQQRGLLRRGKRLRTLGRCHKLINLTNDCRRGLHGVGLGFAAVLTARRAACRVGTCHAQRRRRSLLGLTKSVATQIRLARLVLIHVRAWLLRQQIECRRRASELGWPGTLGEGLDLRVGRLLGLVHQIIDRLHRRSCRSRVGRGGIGWRVDVTGVLLGFTQDGARRPTIGGVVSPSRLHHPLHGSAGVAQWLFETDRALDHRPHQRPDRLGLRLDGLLAGQVASRLGRVLAVLDAPPLVLLHVLLLTLQPRVLGDALRLLARLARHRRGRHGTVRLGREQHLLVDRVLGLLVGCRLGLFERVDLALLLLLCVSRLVGRSAQIRRFVCRIDGTCLDRREHRVVLVRLLRDARGVLGQRFRIAGEGVAEELLHGGSAHADDCILHRRLRGDRHIARCLHLF